MRKAVIWVVDLILFVAVCVAVEKIPWSQVAGYFRQAPETHDVAGESASTAAPPTGEEAEDSVPSRSGKEYFPEDTLQTLYQYSIGGPLFGGVLSGLQKRLTMVHRVDGFRTINGKRYYKEVTEYTGQEDFLELLKNPPAEVREEILKSREIADMTTFLEGLFKTSVEYARWDRSGELDVDGDDLTEAETRGAPLHADVGGEWSQQGLHFKAVSVEDVEIGDQTYKNCLKVRASGTAGATSVHGIVMYNAAGIGTIKMVFPNDVTFVLRKYRR